MSSSASASALHPLEVCDAAKEIPPTHSLKRESYVLTGDPKLDDGAPHSYAKMTCSRANLRAVGWKGDDFRKPIVTIGCPYTNIMPCNNRMLELAEVLAAEIEALGGKAMIATTPAISDGETQGTLGMRYSLVSRDLIADCIETMHEGYSADACITLGGCDKTVPAAMMPLARLNLVGLTLFGGAALPGKCTDLGARGARGLDPGSVMEGIGAYGAGILDVEDLYKLECLALPGSGTCSAMFTACTMAVVTESLGLALPATASPPQSTAANTLNPQKLADCKASAAALMALLRSGVRARDILTRPAFENAIAAVYAVGGSTNAVLHLLALAREAEIDISVADFDEIGKRVPILANLSPHGRYHMADLDAVGGVPVVLKELLSAGLIHGDCLTVTGRTMRDNLASVKPLSELGEQDVVRPVGAPFAPKAQHIIVLKGNLAAQSAVMKLSGKDIARRGLEPRLERGPRPGPLARTRDRPRAAAADPPPRTDRAPRPFGRPLAGSRAPPSSSTARTPRSRPSWRRASPAATSSSFGTRGPKARRACPRCCRPAPRSSGRGWARTWRSSRTVASPAPRTAS